MDNIGFIVVALCGIVSSVWNYRRGKKQDKWFNETILKAAQFKDKLEKIIINV